MAKQTEKEQPEMLFVEAVGMKGSGWIQDDTIGTANPIEMSWPSRFYIPKTGYRKAKTSDGKSFYNEPIRHIANCPEISVAKQQAMNIQPSPDPSEDIIFFEKGCAFFVNEGGTIGTVAYLKESYYNESNPDRSEKATALYRVLKMEEKNEDDLELEMAAADAIKWVGQLYEKKGKNYIYNENAIDAVCQMLQIFGAESYSGKVLALQRLAKQRPDWFLNQVVKLQQTTLTEVTHALDLNVIGFKENSVEYKTKNKVIVSLGNAKLNHEQKISKFADWLRTSDGHAEYMELKAELEAAKEQALKN